MSEFIHALGINWGVMAAQLVNFTILLLVLAKFVYKPVMRLLDERRENIAKAARKEAAIEQKFSALATEREKTLAETRMESERLIAEAKAAAEQAKQHILAGAQEEVARMKAEAEKRLLAEKARLFAEVKRDTGALVVEAVERALGDALDAKSQGRMVEQALAVLKESRESSSN